MLKVFRSFSIYSPKFCYSRQLRCGTSTPLFSEKSIILMGYPGAGKTTVGRIVSERLGLPFLDIDDHHLEPFWGQPVAAKLSSVGPAAFVKEEGEAFLRFTCDGPCVVALSGSNPLHTPAIQHAKKLGYLFYLDVYRPDIVDRLHEIKVDRIVHHDPSVPLEEVLQYRESFYENCYDMRVISEKGESPKSIADKVIGEYYRLSEGTNGFQSTRGGGGKTSFLKATLGGLAEDGGLYVRRRIPSLSLGQWDRLVPLSYTERGLRILEKWISPVLDLPLRHSYQ